MTTSSLPQGGVHVGQGGGTPYWLLTDLLTFKVVGSDTNGAFTVLEVDAGPELGPPPHIHHRCDESFYVLEGRFDFTLGDRAFSAGAGSFVYLPKGIVHTHKAGGGASAKALVVQSPAGIEEFVMAAGKPATDPSSRPGPPTEADLVKVLTAAPNYGIEVPPL